MQKYAISWLYKAMYASWFLCNKIIRTQYMHHREYTDANKANHAVYVCHKPITYITHFNSVKYYNVTRSFTRDMKYIYKTSTQHQQTIQHINKWRPPLSLVPGLLLLVNFGMALDRSHCIVP